MRSPWSSLVDAMPVAWGALVILAILGAAAAIHLALLTVRRRVSPAPLVEGLQKAMEAGNYQEAWELCDAWKRAYLARVLQPALEKIGLGHEPVAAALAERRAAEWKTVTLLSALLLAIGGAAAVATFAAVAGRLHAGSATALSANGERLAALAMGDAAVAAAFGFAVLAPAVFFAWRLRAQARALFAEADEWAAQLVAGLPYEDIEGVRIGSEFDAGTILGDTVASQSGVLRVSRELTSFCPVCNAPINPSRNPCPQCGTPFEWT